MQKRLYITQNLINGKVYAGKHYYKENSKYMGSGYALKKAFKKYGKENFSIRWLRLNIESSEDLDRREIRLIRLLKRWYGKNCYNIQKGGCGGYFIYYMTPEEKQQVFDKIGESKRKQYAAGPTETQLNGQKQQAITLKEKYKDPGFYDKFKNEYDLKRIESLQNRRKLNGPTLKEQEREKRFVDQSTIYVTYKLVFPKENILEETSTLKQFQLKYNTEDNIFSQSKKYGYFTFKRRTSRTKHPFPEGTELHYISEKRACDM